MKAHLLTLRGRRMRQEEAEADAAAPATVLRLAVLLHAGITPSRCWELLAVANDPAAVRIRARAVTEPSLGAAIAQEGGAWQHVAVAWTVATTVGAPLADSLRAVAESLGDAQQAADEVRVALSEPVATARLIAALPVVAIALGLLLGFDTVGVLARSPIGLLAVAAGAVLMIVAWLWTRSLVARARPPGGIAGIDAELMAVALAGGVSIPRAMRVVEDAGVTVTVATNDMLALSRSSGAPARELLRATAAFERHRARVAGRLRASRLSARLLLPMGVCTLPAFMLLGVAPMLLSVLSSTSLTL